jgi:acyl carrier protein
MNETETRQQIFSILKKIAPDTEPDKLQPDENIREALMLDSFDFLRFVVAIDEQFGISTPEEDYSKMGTLKNLLYFLRDKTANKVKDQERR